MELVSSSFYRKRTSRLAFDRDGLDLATLQQLQAAGQGAAGTDVGQDTKFNDVSNIIFQDLHLNGALGERVKWLVGAEYVSLESVQRNINTRTPTNANRSPGTITNGLLDQETWAVYGLLGVDVTDRLNLTGELRYTQDNKTFEVGRVDLGTGLVVNPARFCVIAGNKPNNLSYTAAAAYKLAPDCLAYAKVGTGYRSSGFNEDLGDPRQPTPVILEYGDETQITYEIGLKGGFAKWLNFALSGYRSDTDNILIQQDNGCQLGLAPCFSAPTNFVRNGGRARLWGVEFESTVRA